MNTILDCRKLKKSFAAFEFGPLDLKVDTGECVAFLGHNGAGKSTFFQMITGQLDPTSGEIRFLDQKMTPENFELKRSLGYLPQNLELPDWICATEVLDYAAKLYGIPQTAAANALKLWAVEGYKRTPLIDCSHGMKKRVGLALASIHDPDLLILDEPFSGLDIAHIRTLKQLVAQRQKEGKTTFLSTHILPYAGELCSRALLLSNGQVRELEQWKNQSSSERSSLGEAAIFNEGSVI
ncbi:ABC transporter ATP-binding protein [Oligoflexaceae bacterium]|nr:ABC transporter ATP-binding protein [Oligoflexaceae bacterium]